jgi:putative aldouronate transport system substrate-binding protein
MVRNGYVGSDPLQDNDPTAMFHAGRLAATHQNASIYITLENSLRNSLPDAELGVWVFSPTVRFGVKKAEGSGFNAWNFLAVPTTSKNLDKIMEFMDWIYSDRSNYDLLTYGIEGTHWVPAGNDKYDFPSNFNPANTYDFPFYILTMNPLLVRYPVAMPDVVLKATLDAADATTFYLRPTTGFSIITTSIETEMAKLNDLLAYRSSVNAGLYANVEAEVARIQAMFDDAGFRIVAAEIERQFNEYLRTHPYEGQ